MLRIAAIIAVRNGAPTLSRVLSHLRENQIDVIAIDHGSVDDTPQILESHSPHPLIEVIRVPFDGVHRWRKNLALKVEIAERIGHDWIIHVDADEIMESPKEGETLREMIERLHEAGFERIDCDEFAFVPSDEDEDHSGGDYVATMRRYYYIVPKSPKQRAIRAGSGPIDWANSGGHKAGGEERRAPAEKIRIRHYLGLSIDHLRAQYLGRVFGAEELSRGWHRKRVATTPDFIVAPPADRLFDLDVDGWRTDRPESRHLIFEQRKPYRIPTSIASDSVHPPMPFVVGVPRSGTTLLRLMLDSHPDLSIPPETHWLGPVIRTLQTEPADTDALRAALTSHELWPEIELDDRALDGLLADHDPKTPFDTLRSIYLSYAMRRAAVRVGDKTPAHGLLMTEIARALPEARFIHLIRDGRDVAVSLRGLWFGPGEDPRDAAVFWLWRIRVMRQQAEFLPHYLEVHYEDLVRDPEPVLRRIGEFIDLPFHPTQLSAHRHARSRLAELAGRLAKGRFVTAEDRRSIHRQTEKPPTTSRIGRWQQEMQASDLATFERIAGDMLLDLGYELSPSRR